EATSSFIDKKQKITISSTPTFASKWLIPKLADFTAAHPDIELQILATEKMSHFQNDGVDLAIRYGQVPSNAGLNTELLIQDSFMVVASPDLVKLEQSSLSLNELFKYPLLHDAHHLWSIFLEKLSSEISLNILKSIRFNQTALAIDAAIAAQGIVLTNPLFIDAELKNGKLIKIYEQELEMDTGFYLVSPRYSKNSENVTRVRNWLLSQFPSF
ncbi:MAG: LysR family transcriptional regulator, partial [Acinetobacter sp.]|nr:LysR family transcriptional regulator [Acinetobacter sp.]